jgi:hypothetical protein
MGSGQSRESREIAKPKREIAKPKREIAKPKRARLAKERVVQERTTGRVGNPSVVLKHPERALTPTQIRAINAANPTPGKGPVIKRRQSKATIRSAQTFQMPPPPEFQPVKLLPPNMENKIPDMRVSEICVAGHKLKKTGGNHWCLYLVVGEKESVWIDASPSFIFTKTGGQKANIAVSYVTYAQSNQASRAVVFTPLPG